MTTMKDRCYNQSMDIQQMKYFLAIAKEGSISKAAELLYMTQPSLTRQVQNMEREIGKPLLIRGGKRLKLTETGESLKKRAEEIVELFGKAELELMSLNSNIGGDIYIGGGETRAMKILTDIAAKVHNDHPEIRFHLHSGDIADVCEKLDKGLIDFGLMIEPAHLAEYKHLTLPFFDEWGIILPSSHPLAQKQSISPEDLAGVPLLRSKHAADRSSISEWISRIPDQKLIATYNLLYNASLMAEAGMGCVLCIDGIINLKGNDALCFRPLEPAIHSGISVAWKQDQLLSKAASLFLEYMKKEFNS